MKLCIPYKIFFLSILFSLCSFTTHAATPLLKVKIANAGYSDEIAIRFMQGATVNFDGCCDAWKLFSQNLAIPNLFTRIEEAGALAINSLPPLSGSLKIALFARIGIASTYSITPTQVDSFASASVILTDNVTGNMYDLKTGRTYAIGLPVIIIGAPARFTIQITVAQPELVQLTKFNARDYKRDVLLAWVTAMERNSESFSVERAFITNADAVRKAEMHFVSVGIVAGAGNSNSEKKYEYADHPGICPDEAGALCYRLKEVNLDGSSNYFGPVGVTQSNSNNPDINIYPVVSNDTFFISGDISNSLVRVYAPSGQPVYSKRIGLLSAGEPLSFEMQKQPNGIYSLRVIKEGKVLTQKIILNH